MSELCTTDQEPSADETAESSCLENFAENEKFCENQVSSSEITLNSNSSSEEMRIVAHDQPEVAPHRNPSDPELESVVKKESHEKDMHTSDRADRSRTASITSSSSSSSQEFTVFNGVTYLGSATINAPRSEIEIYRNMSILNQQGQMAIEVTLLVPAGADGIVRLLEPASETEIASYSIQRVIFCARGQQSTSEENCFAFTTVHGDGAESSIFQCHVFRCKLVDAVAKILFCFYKAFRNTPNGETKKQGAAHHKQPVDDLFRFSVSLEIKEEDGKGSYSAVPKDKEFFKLRADVEKKIIITVTQLSNRELSIDRCFGLLLCPGRNVKNSDMHLIDMVSMGKCNDAKSYAISGTWNPLEPNYALLNNIDKDKCVFMTVAVDLVIVGIQDPVRFVLEARAKVFPSTERFWYLSKRSHVEEFNLRLKPVDNSKGGELQHEVLQLESLRETEKKKAGMQLDLRKGQLITQTIATPTEEHGESDDDLMLSGTGIVSKEAPQDVLVQWGDVLTKWHKNLSERPRGLQALVRRGIPEALRAEVWQLLAHCEETEKDMIEAYRLLITKESPSEDVILRDINRTFPAHDFFRESGGVGQDGLYKLSKAYSIYDEEVGYCQGLSFLAASLLLHLPEEQAFNLLIRVMFKYEMREVFKHNFENLHMRFYQLERLIQDQIPDIYYHFMDLGVEAHMYASQWFLTLFTAKFPLYMVFHIIDVFLAEGINVIFNVALALLKTSRRELLALDFEGVLKFFRVSLPKKYRHEEEALELMNQAMYIKITNKKLKKYEKEYLALKENEAMQADPVERLTRENQRLQEANMRLEQENDSLAHELVTSKVKLRRDLDEAEDRAETTGKAHTLLMHQHNHVIRESERMSNDLEQLRDLLEAERSKFANEIERNRTIIAEYKQITGQLSERLEKQQTAAKQEIAGLKTQLYQLNFANGNDGTELAGCDMKGPPVDSSEMEKLDVQIRELELELAQTKLALVESECRTQDLTHQLNSLLEQQSTKNTWLHKTLNTLRDAAVSSKSTLSTNLASSSNNSINSGK